MILKYTLFFREVLDSNIQTKTEQKLERHHTYPSFTYTQSLLSSVSYNRIQGLQSMTPHWPIIVIQSPQFTTELGLHGV